MIRQSLAISFLQMDDTIVIHFNIVSWEVVTLSTHLLQDSGWVFQLSVTLSERLVMSSGKSCHKGRCQNLNLAWKRIADGFYTRLNFLNCLGALDGKHIEMKVPPKSASQFFKYTGTFSIILMALVDDDYRFTYIDIGDYGSNSDGTVFKNCTFGKAFMNDELDVPPPTHLPKYPAYCLVVDEAFPLCCDLMRPSARLSAVLEQAMKVLTD